MKSVFQNFNNSKGKMTILLTPCLLNPLKGTDCNLFSESIIYRFDPKFDSFGPRFRMWEWHETGVEEVPLLLEKQVVLTKSPWILWSEKGRGDTEDDIKGGETEYQ